MDDEKIITMFQERDESAIRELNNKYGPYCSKIAWNILENREDVEECVNDTWFSVWTYNPAAGTEGAVCILWENHKRDCHR